MADSYTNLLYHMIFSTKDRRQMHEVFPELNEFSWQRGYGAFTVSQSNVYEVRRYIATQENTMRRSRFATSSFSF